MADFDEDRRMPVKGHTVGEDLASLSEHELEERITVLEGEIGRIREVLAGKKASREAADSFFKR